jgi:hemerythrin-like domain-containing protein
MDNKANDTIDKATRFLELLNRHLKEKNCKHTIVEIAKEFVDSLQEKLKL